MFPILLTFGPIQIYSFGVFTVLAFLLGSFTLWRSLRDEVPEEQLLVGSLLTAIGALSGARLAPVLGTLLTKPIAAGLTSGRLSFWGALVGGILMLFLWGKAKQWKWWDMVDTLGVVFLLVTFVMGFGCELAGCWEAKSSALWNVIGGKHPLGWYLAAWSLLGILIGAWIKKHYRSWQWYKSGKIGLIGLFSIGWFSLGYLTIASLVKKQLYWGPFAANQWVAAGVLVIILALIYWRSGHSPREIFTWQKNPTNQPVNQQQ